MLLADPPGAPAPLAELAGRPLSAWRYAEALGVPAEHWRAATLGEGITPLLATEPGLSVKVEYASPTLSFKDRGVVLLLAQALAAGASKVVADSSGNAGTAVAAYSARVGLPAEIFVPENTSPKKVAQVRAHGAEVRLVPGDREATAAAALDAVERGGAFYASHVHNPVFHLGTATYGFEVWEQLGGRLPDTLVLPVGNGTLVLGVTRAVAGLLAAGLISSAPRIVAVQAANCAPLAAAWREGSAAPVAVASRPTIAEGIAIAAPARGAEILAAVDEFATVEEDQVLTARTELARRGWYVEDTAAVCWAAARAAAGTWGSVVVPLSGAGLKTGWTV
jgi:threonine synthase